MQTAEGGVVSVRSWAPLSSQSFLQGDEEETAGLRKARGKGVRIVRRKADESCLLVRMDSKTRGLNHRLLTLQKT